MDGIDTTPMGSYLKAESFRRAAMLLARRLRGGGGFDGDPIRYNFYHSVELYLKAALVCDGYSDDQLRRQFRHGFRALADEVNARGFGLTEATDLQTLELIDHDGNYLRSRYHRRGYFTVSTVQALNLTAHECAYLAAQRLRKHGLLVRNPAPRLSLDRQYPW